MGFTLILFNVKLFTRYYTITSKDFQSQEKLKFFKKCCQNQFIRNVIMVAENFTIFITQLLIFRGQVHTCKFIQRDEKLFIYFFKHYIYCIKDILYNLLFIFTNYHLFHNFSFSVQIIQTF